MKIYLLFIYFIYLFNYLLYVSCSENEDNDPIEREAAELQNELTLCTGYYKRYVDISINGNYEFNLKYPINDMREASNVLYEIKFENNNEYYNLCSFRSRQSSISNTIMPNCISRYIYNCDWKGITFKWLDTQLHNSFIFVRYTESIPLDKFCVFPVMKFDKNVLNEKESISFSNPNRYDFNFENQILHFRKQRVVQQIIKTNTEDFTPISAYLCANAWSQPQETQIQELKTDTNELSVENFINSQANIDSECPPLNISYVVNSNSFDVYFAYAECYQQHSLIYMFRRTTSKFYVTSNLLQLPIGLKPICCGDGKIIYGLEFLPKRYNMIIYAYFGKFYKVATCQKTKTYSVCISHTNEKFELKNSVFLEYIPFIRTTVIRLKATYEVIKDSQTSHQVDTYSTLDHALCENMNPDQVPVSFLPFTESNLDIYELPNGEKIGVDRHSDDIFEINHVGRLSSDL